MSFVDLLRQSRCSPTALLHQFLTNYDPTEPRVYAFVEGDADRAFYRAFIQDHLSGRRLYVYDCEGKKGVFDAYAKVTGRHPDCRNVLFFVDKDVDDLVGKAWPSDPRIFTTELYSVESYIVNGGAVGRYFADFVRLRRVSVDLSAISAGFEPRLKDFHGAVRALMCWVIAARRAGSRVVLSDLRLAKIFTYDGTRTLRIRAGDPLRYLSEATQTPISTDGWRQTHRVCRELRHRDPKRYIRGKFEAWFLVEFVKRALADISRVAEEANGGLSIGTPLHESNFVQVLARGISAPASLDAFLRFHLGAAEPLTTPPPAGFWQRLREGIAAFFGSR